jgi:hypothetical protein
LKLGLSDVQELLGDYGEDLNVYPIELVEAAPGP